MATITGSATLSYIDLYTSDTTIPSGYYLGMKQEGADGKVFRYVLAGASNLVVGNVLQSSAYDSQFTNMAVPAGIASGVQQVTITNGTTAVTANQYVGGSINVYTTPGLCDEYTILGHNTPASGEAFIIQIDRPLRTAWTTSTKVNVKRSPWSGVIQSPATTLTGSAAGVAIYAIPAGQYGWIQTGGVASVLSDGSSILVGSPVAVPSGTAGAVILGATNLMQIGQAMQPAASAHGITVDLMLD